ncbi:conserved hypothetical protein [Methylocella tundrae]|uniref:Uncharacterized protein n=1 Tax=Methylocella tundrae TaxID=227605 RepID=A0A8B6MAS7_METTU|nr:hypothetical protein [Methylocella tundrae]VTZ21109.1 conserved hypothetical protein [Methylocella tundrae]VTZ51831.1 conserved hypothetical protein [Methylocella tundrae]
MLQQFVTVQDFGGKPLKRVLMTTSEQGVHVADPGMLSAIKFGISAPTAVNPRHVFNFDEPIFDDLMSQWQAKKETCATTWAKLGQFQASDHDDDCDD